MPEKKSAGEPDLGVSIAGIDMKTPLVLASGVFGYGFEIPRVEGFDFNDVGAVVLKSVTLRPREGNPPPRIAETPSGVLNSIGMQNPGVEFVAKNYLPQLKKIPTNFIANIAGENIDEYVQVARILADSDSIKALEVNVSCPNVEWGCCFGVNPGDVFSVVSGVKSVCDKPVFVKLAPAVTDIQNVASACVSAHADAISMGNTYSGMVIDTRRRRPLLGNNTGGLSGPAIRPLTVFSVFRVWQGTHRNAVPIVAFGGVATANDAIEMMLAGASAVGVGTALFSNTHICSDIAEGLRAYLKSQNESKVSDIIGTVKLNQT